MLYAGGGSPIRGVSGHDYVNDPKYRDHREKQPRREIVTKPTRDLNDDRVWSGGSRDFDERTGTNRPGHRGGGYEFNQTEKGRARERFKRGLGTKKTSQGAADFLNERGIKPDDKAGLTRAMIEYDRQGSRRERLRPEPKKDWWNEPKKEYRPEKSAKERRLELLTGGGGGRSSDSDRQALLTGRGLSSNEDRMSMLTGRSDPPKEEWQSQYGGRREYDPQDREFNRQFNTEPTDNRDVRSWFPDSEPSRPVSKPSSFPDDVGPGKKYPYGKPDPSHPPGVIYSKGPGPAPDTNQNTTTGSETNAWGQKPLNSREIAEWNKKQEGFAKAQENYETRLKALEGRPQTGGWQENRIAALENRPQSTGSNWDESRIKALESRKPLVNQPTVDLSGIKERLSQVEGRGSDWQEDRIKALEGKKPQDLSGIQGRLSELEGKGPSWQEDRVKQLEGSRSESKSARNLLDQRIATLEDYYRNDPPPEESTGNRYEDKMAELNRAWEVTNPTYDPDRLISEDHPNSGWLDWTWGKRGENEWAKSLPKPYEQQMRALNREYNKPTYEATIKGRDYKAYGALDKSRLKYLDNANIHEDEYLGSGSWENQYGENVSGWGQGNQDRYFTSQSGLDKDSDEYKDRFKHRHGTGKDYAYYG